MQDLWNTVSKYPRLVAGLMVGVILFALAPLAPLLKNPVTAVAVIGFFVAGFAFFTFTLRAMLGI
ncbi:DUF751 family protein [Myxacorys almedinensis]|uniref:DUF751 domain-containing protein n=1 Tax=Myxacorys almedinensis A TaxID=2690445 RepID=A0A8J8CIQ3_9CYAN|nr:DUF751 family protein [Myxacorys almedinensis]NDJ18153.1 DUF751 domain-containing protein [Myxacorys almedinensis A]